jgi:hypothetical protein
MASGLAAGQPASFLKGLRRIFSGDVAELPHNLNSFSSSNDHILAIDQKSSPNSESYSTYL